ncbi:hypothetical protein [Cellvibrio polysaccharolyticus]|uniref:Uncharacterized protein n=1 Tax=Cellvibrio polysaccharolyticus TaxID=2082724 RepID=A0A928YV83_9GAMM|nr:hypothetical protein [Cellvibrio polysaccharolyticus]MBE8718769.1 hypothetical protein [Cellvibrio polysaccharolyticus]
MTRQNYRDACIRFWNKGPDDKQTEWQLHSPEKATDVVNDLKSETDWLADVQTGLDEQMWFSGSLSANFFTLGHLIVQSELEKSRVGVH